MPFQCNNPANILDLQRQCFRGAFTEWALSRGSEPGTVQSDYPYDNCVVGFLSATPLLIPVYVFRDYVRIFV